MHTFRVVFGEANENSESTAPLRLARPRVQLRVTRKPARSRRSSTGMLLRSPSIGRPPKRQAFRNADDAIAVLMPGGRAADLGVGLRHAAMLAMRAADAHCWNRRREFDMSTPRHCSGTGYAMLKIEQPETCRTAYSKRVEQFQNPDLAFLI